MDIYQYHSSEHNSNLMLTHLGAHPHFMHNPEETLSHIHSNVVPIQTQQYERCDQIVVLDSSRIAMQIASGEITWPILPKPKDFSTKLDTTTIQTHPCNHNNVATELSWHTDLNNSDFVHGEGPTPASKFKIKKRRPAQDMDAHDIDGGNEKQAIMRWKDIWVSQLIHVRGRMQAAFSAPQKQRIDLWQVIKNEMARTCYGFDKDSEACRKKWRRVYKEYKDDKYLHVSGNGTRKCRFYELMELYMGESCNGISEPHALSDFSFGVANSVKDEVPPATNEVSDANALDSTIVNGNSIIEGSAAIENYDFYEESNGGEVTAAKKSVRRGRNYGNNVVDSVSSNSLQPLLSELISVGREMLQTTRQYEQEKLDILFSLKETLNEISARI